MNLTITQDNTRTETINSSIIDKLYEIAFAASSDPNSTVSLTGNLYSAKGYANKADWLNETFGPDLIITIASNGQYMLITDAALEAVLKNSVGDGDGVFLDLLKAANPLDSVLGTGSNTDIVDTRELCLIEGSLKNGSFLLGCSNIKTLGFPCNITYFRFARGATIENIVVKNLKNFISGDFAINYTFNRPSTGWDLYTTSDGINITKIENLIIPSDATFSNSINQTPFLYCKSVKNVTVPYNITSLRGFYRSMIESITFEQGSVLTSILNECFQESSNLVFDVANLPLTITTIGNNAFRSCSNVTGVLDLPNLTSLGQYSFYSTGITSIADLGSITSVSDMCFNNCDSLTTVTLPNTITSVSDMCFNNCDSLTTVTLPNSCTSIGGGAFAYCDALQSIDLGGVTTIANLAFIADPALTTVTGTSNLTSIGSAAFLNCSNISGALDLSNAVTIGNNAFNNTHISSVILSKAETIDLGAFANTNISSITLPSTLRTVHAQFVNFCPIEKIIIPEGCTTIIGGLFNTKNKALRYWEIPSTVTDMGFFFHNSFISSNGGYDQNSLYLVIKASTPPALTYYSGLTGATYAQFCAGIYVPDASLQAYQNAGDAWQHANVQAKLKPISLLLTDSPTWWAEYLTRANS